MIIGVDFDNTIANYTGVFHRVATQLGWLTADVGESKNEVKAYFIDNDTEAKWTELQGIVYGKEINQAHPYQDCLAQLQELKAKGHQLKLISHKTKYPIIGEPVDFHQAATDWLQDRGFVGGDDSPLVADDLFFNQTLTEKVEKIAALNCQYFIDDLPKVLAHPSFPTDCSKILFQPQLAANLTEVEHSNDLSSSSSVKKITNWREIQSVIC